MKTKGELENFFKNAKPSEVVQLVIDGLETPIVEVDMESYGYIYGNGKCVGCAATNALLKLCGIDKPINGRIKPSEIYNSVLLHFIELFFNSLRLGQLIFASNYFFKVTDRPNFLPIPPFDLPKLKTDNYKDGLPQYKKYVAWLKKQGH